MNKHEFHNIRPGDIGFDGGIGFSGWLIRLATRSPYGHCFVYHSNLGNGLWETAEAGPSGLLFRKRSALPTKVVRFWRNENERAGILWASEKLVGSKYDWSEIGRIAARLIGLRLRCRKDNKARVICSNHVAQAVLAIRPELTFYLRFAPYEVWPGELAMSFDAMLWDTEVAR